MKRFIIVWASIYEDKIGFGHDTVDTIEELSDLMDKRPQGNFRAFDTEANSNSSMNLHQREIVSTKMAWRVVSFKTGEIVENND